MVFCLSRLSVTVSAFIIRGHAARCLLEIHDQAVVSIALVLVIIAVYKVGLLTTLQTHKLEDQGLNFGRYPSPLPTPAL